MRDWPNTERRGYAADMGSAVGLMEAHVRIDNLRGLLERALALASTKHWRDRAGLGLDAHPLWDEIRAALHD